MSARRGTRALPLAALFLVTLGLVAGCSAGAGGHLRDRRPAARFGAGLRRVDLGVRDGRVSVLVRNDAAVAVPAARAVVEARDASGALVAAASGGRCCAIGALAPRATTGIYLDLGRAARRVTSVSLHWAAAPDRVVGAQVPVAVRDVGLQTGSGRTVVTARLDARFVTSVRAQAVLRDRAGRLVAVLTSRRTCLLAASPVVVALALPGPVPAGTVVTAMTVSPAPANGCD